MKTLFHLFFCHSEVHFFHSGRVRINIRGPFSYLSTLDLPPGTSYSIPTLITHVRTYSTLPRLTPFAPSREVHSPQAQTI